MAHQKDRSQEEEQAKEDRELEKKLRKRESRLEERLQEAQERRAKALERLKRAEARLQKRTARIELLEGRIAMVRWQQAELTALTEPAPEEKGGELTQEEIIVALVEPAELAGEARAVAEAAEEAAWLAAVRAVEVSSRLGQFEEEQASAIAQEAERAAREAERLAEEVDQLVQEVGSESVAEIEEEEEVVAAVAAMMIADVAAAAAAEAEAMAEASSARTHEARYAALQADQVLEKVRTAVASGALSGEDARTTLQNAEREATRAHARLADAEAEVAEGMAFAAGDLVEQSIEDAQGLTEPTESIEQAASAQPLVNNAEAHAHDTLPEEVGVQEKQGEGGEMQVNTEELPVVHGQEQV